MFKYSIFSILVFSSLFCFCQLMPGASPGWVLNTNMTDEFNSGTTFNPAKWTWNPAFSGVNGETCFQSDINNISVQSGYARLAIREENSTCIDHHGVTNYLDYSSGVLFGLSEQKYGYFEVRFKISNIPSTPDSLNGLSANAWLWRSWAPFSCVWSEIDLAEIDCIDHRHTCNVIYDPNQCDSVYVGPPMYQNIPIPSQSNMRCVSDPCNPTTDFNLMPGWHIYSAVWHPNGIAIYVDNIQINKTFLGGTGMYPLNWIIGPGTGAYQFSDSIGPNTLLPFFMDVDYVRTYTLNMDCANVVNTCSFNFLSHDNKVKKSITIGGTGCSNTMPTSGSGSNVALRATDFIEIKGEFTVPVGSQLSIETIGWY